MLNATTWLLDVYAFWCLSSLIIDYGKTHLYRFAQISIFVAKCSLLRGAFFALLLLGRLSTIWLGERGLLPFSQITPRCSLYATIH